MKVPDLLQMAGFATVMQKKGRRADAVNVARQVLHGAPPESEAWHRARAVLNAGVPGWHIPLLHDEARAAAYDRAIRRAVRPGMVVLDVGTGSGLLAMMAARAGAERVIACEAEPALALLARDNVDRNGFTGRIDVIAKHSRDLVVGVDLPRRADLLISEIVTNSVLGQDVLATMQAARRDLLLPATPTIPRAAHVHVAASAAPLGRYRPLEHVAGFDVGAVNLVAPQSVKMVEPLHLVSDAETMFSFDLSGGQAPAGRAARELTVDRPSEVTGIAQWMTLDLDEAVTVSTGPGTASSAWAVLLFPLPRPIRVEAGHTIQVHAAFGADALAIWTESERPIITSGS